LIGCQGINSRSSSRIDVPLRLVLGVAVTLLETSGEFGLMALDDVKVVVGQLAPCC
jgi:hypothetical protein